MDISKVQESTSSQVSTQAVAAKTTETKAAQTARQDSVELSNRNPANKKELMATYAKIRAAQPQMQRQAILNTITGGKNSVATPEIPVPKTAATAPAPAAEGPKTQAVPTDAAVPAGNKITNAGKMEATVANAAGNTGNTINGPQGFASSNNRVAVNGANNTVDIGGTMPQGTREATYNATGGAAINNANINVTGSGNAVKFTGRMQDDNTVNLNGNNNQINIGNNVDKANINVAGNSVTLNMADNNPLTKNQNNWNVNVNASDVNITIENGEAKVTGANGNQNFKVEIDNKSRSVTVTQLPQQNVQTPNPAEDLGA